MIWIKNAHVVDPGNQVEGNMDICIADGKIAGVGEQIKLDAFPASKEDVVIDASGFIVAPGFVDVHVHFRDPGLTYKEDIQTGARAAAKGGFTAVVCMANTKPPVDNLETLQYVEREGKKTGIHVLQAAAVSKGLLGRELTDMEELKAHGAVGFTDDGIPLLDEKLVKEAMERAAELNVHTGAAVDIQHISSAASVKMVKLAKELGAQVYAEVTPHHFTLTEDAVLTHGTLAKMNPPLRTEEDRMAIIQGLKDGSIDIIATDHAPHSAEEKAKKLTEAPSGIIGLETALGLGVTNLVRPGHLTMMQLMEKMSLNPSRLYRLDFGFIKEGGAADLVIFDPKEEWTVGEYVSKSSNSPFTGERLFGRVKYTICSGRIVYQDEKD